jgi:hypothetical protein
MDVFRASRDGRREEAGVGERARDEAIEGRGEETVDISWWREGKQL